jgi:hypothetical protein
MTKALVQLLKALFTADELRRFAAFLPGSNLVAALPGDLFATFAAAVA